MINSIIYLFIGGLAGISMGTIGVGAGLITIPLLIMNGLNINQAVAAGLVMQLFPQSAPGLINYWKHVLWLPSILVVLGSLIGIWIGSKIIKEKLLSNRFLYRIITVFLLFTSVYFYVCHWNDDK